MILEFPEIEVYEFNDYAKFVESCMYDDKDAFFSVGMEEIYE